MSAMTRLLGRAVVCALSAGLSVLLQAQDQAPVQFRADIQVRDLNGKTGAGVPLPPTPAGLKGTRTVPLKFNGYEGPATVEWTIAPIAVR